MSRYSGLALAGLLFAFLYLLANFETWQIQSLIPASLLPNVFAPLFSSSSSSQDVLEPYHLRLVAVGDLHGDALSAQKVLKFSGVVDDNGDWIKGGVDVLVQTGDIVDRGDDTIKLFEWMDQLLVQAHSHGAMVVSHLGNHEYMNALGDWRYVYPSELATQFNDSIAQRQYAISHEGPIGASWAKAENYHVTSRVPLHPSLGPVNSPYPSNSESPLGDHAALSFVHGGISPSYQDMVPYPTRINELGSSLLRKGQERLLQDREAGKMPHPPGPYAGLPSGTSQAEAALYDSNGPLWYRGWAYETNEVKLCRDVDLTLQKIGARRMIMGHTPDFHNIVARCNGKIIIIDTGISRAYGGRLSALRIDYTLSKEKGKWVEEEKVVKVYEDSEEVITVDIRVIE